MKTLQFTLVSHLNTFIGRINANPVPPDSMPVSLEPIPESGPAKKMESHLPAAQDRCETDLHGLALCVLWVLMQFDTSFKYLHAASTRFAIILFSSKFNFAWRKLKHQNMFCAVLDNFLRLLKIYYCSRSSRQ